MYDVQAIRALGVVRVLTEIAGCEWKREGGWMITRCPFHDDRKPTFKVGTQRPDRGRCFACEAKGDVIELAERLLKLDTRATLEALAARFGLTESAATAPAPASREKGPPTDAAEPVPEVSDAVAAELEVVFGLAAEMAETTDGRAYIDGRGLGGANLTDVRFVPHPLRFWEVVQRTALSSADTKRLGVRGLYTFVNRQLPFLLFACRDPRGRIAGFHARHTGPNGDVARWIFAGPAGPWPFVVRPADDARTFDPDAIVWCEGATDALAWSAAGYTAAGLPGVGGVRPWMARLMRIAARRVYIAPDADAAGRRAVAPWRAIAEAEGLEAVELDVSAAGVEGAKDAGDLAARGLLSALSALPVAARIDSAPEPLRQRAIEALEEAAAGETAPERREDERAPAPAPAPEPEASREGAKALPDTEPDIAPDELTLAFIRERMPSLSLRWTLHLARTWWAQGHKGAPDQNLIASLAIEWFQAHGARFVRDSADEPHVYWQRGLRHIGTRNRLWLGTMWREGQVNRETREGRVILEALQAHAWAQTDAPRVQPWAFFDRDRNEIAVHTHDAQDRIVVVGAKGLRVENNGDGPVLLRTDPGTRAIDASGRPNIKKAAELLATHFVLNLATEPHERALFTAWVLTCWLRQRLNTRALLFAQGAAGSGKSQAAKAATALIFGEERLIDPTPAACRTEGALQPLVTLDNKETRNMGEAVMQFLLLSATGITRKKRAEGTTDGIHDEQINALVLVTAIEPPGLPELAARTMTVRFRHDLQRAGFAPMAELRALVKHRSTILVGVWGILAELLAGHARDKMRALLELVPGRHPRARLGEHLALMAYIAGELRNACPDIWGDSRPDAADLLRAWLDEEAVHARDQALGTDPIYAAMQALLWSWNRIVMRHDGPFRPAVDDQQFRCRPLYLGAGGRLVTADAEATRYIRGSTKERVVGGWAGSYTDLHADLMRASRETSGGTGYAEAIKSAGVLAARMHRNTALEDGGWHAELVRTTSTGRTYRFWIDPARIDAAAADLDAEAAANARVAEPALPF